MNITTSTRSIFAAIALAILALLLSMPALSATMCSPPAGTVGRVIDGGDASCLDGTLLPCSRMFVGQDGYWHACQPWVPDGGDPQAPRPVDADPDCKPRTGYERWGGPHGDMCHSLPAGATTRPEYYTLGAGKPGQGWLIRDDTGNARGMRLYRCTRGQWVPETPERCAYLVDPNQPAPPKPKPKPGGGDATTGPVQIKPASTRRK